MPRESIRAIFDDPRASRSEVNNLLFGPSGPGSVQFLHECIDTVLTWQVNRHRWRGAPIDEAKEMAILAIGWIAKWCQIDPEASCTCLCCVAAKGLPQSLSLVAFESVASLVGPDHPLLDEVVRRCEDPETQAMLVSDLDLWRSGDADGSDDDDDDKDQYDDPMRMRVERSDGPSRVGDIWKS